MTNERVLVLPGAKLGEYVKYERGLITEIDIFNFSDFLEKNGKFLERDVAEHDDSFRQVIPYMVLLKDHRYIIFRRTEQQTEKRLHNRITMGVGGHINDMDGKNPLIAYVNGLKRELNEEVDCTPSKLQFIGLIVSDADEVSRVHVGAVYIVHLADYRGVREKENFEEIRTKHPWNYLHQMELWSRLVADFLKKQIGG